MKAIFKNLSATISALAASAAAHSAINDPTLESALQLDPYKGLIFHGLLNDGELPEYLAGHRSHSSHGSHGSHRSSAGSSKPRRSFTPAPAPAPAPAPRVVPKISDPLGQQPKPPAQTYRPAIPDASALQNNRELRATVIRQIQGKLKLLGYYRGSVDGMMGPMTRDAIDVFKIAKGDSNPRGGYLDIATLNALGIRIP